MALRVVVLESARMELAEAAAWYERERAQLGGDFVVAYETILGHALEFPQTGSLAAKLTAEHEVRRFVFERFPYDLVTMKRVHDLFVVAVAHHHRTPGYWRRRLAKLVR